MDVTLTQRNSRTRKILIGSFSLVASTGLAMGVGLIMAGMLARFFSPEEFGLWSILISLNGILLNGFDFGFGNALRNRMAQLYAGHHDEECRSYYLSIFYWFICSAVVMSLIFISIKPIIPWYSLFRHTDPLLIETGASLMAIGASILAFNIAFNIYTAGFFSYQESHWNALVNAIGKIGLLLVTILLVVSMQSFFIINLMIFIITILSSAAAFMVFMARRKWRYTLIPGRSIIEKIGELWYKSAQFAFLQIFSTFILMSDLFVVSKLLGLEMVGEFFLVKRIYLVLASFHFAILLPIWSAYTESIESKDVRWAESALKKSAVYTVIIFISGTVAMFFGGHYIIYWWTGKTILDMSLFIWLGLWGLLYGWSNCFSVFLNATGHLKYQVILGGFAATALVPLSLFLGGLWGVAGICIALIVVGLPFGIIAPIESIAIIRRLHRGIKQEA